MFSPTASLVAQFSLRKLKLKSVRIIANARNLWYQNIYFSDFNILLKVYICTLPRH